jgi:hypothetical protein
MHEDPTVDLSKLRLPVHAWHSRRNRPHRTETFVLYRRDDGTGAVMVNRGRWVDPPKPTRSTE